MFFCLPKGKKVEEKLPHAPKTTGKIPSSSKKGAISSKTAFRLYAPPNPITAQEASELFSYMARSASTRRR